MVGAWDGMGKLMVELGEYRDEVWRWIFLALCIDVLKGKGLVSDSRADSKNKVYIGMMYLNEKSIFGLETFQISRLDEIIQ